jgi:thiol-disulfide isomerase/thioredoxin
MVLLKVVGDVARAMVMGVVAARVSWGRPLSRWQVGLLAVLAVLLVAGAGSVRLIGFVARADEPADAPLPDLSAKELADRLREAGKPYDKGILEAAFEKEQDTNLFGTDPKTGKALDPVYVKFPGRFRHASDGRSWRTEYDSSMPNLGTRKLTPRSWAVGFDGSQDYRYDPQWPQVELGAGPGEGLSFTPRALFWHHLDSLLERLARPSTTVGQRTVDGVRCYVVRSTTSDREWGSEEVISPRQSYLVVQTAWSHRGVVYHAHQLHDLVRTADGLWFPRRITSESWNVKPDGSKKLSDRQETRIVRFEPGKKISEDSLRFEIPYGADVVDRRSGQAYHNDPWWPEASVLLRARFDWPKTDLSALNDLGTGDAAKLDGKVAPPVRAATWINSDPLDWQRLRGKVVLLEFWGTWCAPCRRDIPALRRLYELYQPAGLEIVAVHTSTDKPEDVRKFAGDFRMPYPIALDKPQEGAGGATAAAFGVQGYPTAFLVDHTGKVHAVERGRLVATLTDLLKQAGAKDVPPVDLGEPRMSDEMHRVIRGAFREWVKRAPALGEISVAVTDNRGTPLAGAQVEARLCFRMLHSNNPAGHTLEPYPQRFAATRAPDGSLVLSGLVKGWYELKISAPGKAVLDREVTLKPSLEPVALTAVLTQGDTIAGRVRDESGKPVVNATVTARHRHYDLTNLDVYTTGQIPPPATTDEAGGFRFRGLHTGAYTFDVTAPGFEKGVLEKVPAGGRDVEVTLKRPRPGPPPAP